MKIVIIDYGMGNIKSITSALKYLGVKEVTVSNELSQIMSADKLILPGVGSFAKAMTNIKDLHLDEYLKEAVLAEKKPILGICLGMQLMGKSSTEDGYTEGLEFVPGIVERFQEKDLKVPHVGFNQVSSPLASRLYDGLKESSDFYFTHSYRMHCDSDINQSYCDYEKEFVASFEVGNIAGVQFHPELSQTNGLKLLDNFLKNF